MRIYITPVATVKLIDATKAKEDKRMYSDALKAGDVKEAQNDFITLHIPCIFTSFLLDKGERVERRRVNEHSDLILITNKTVAEPPMGMR